MFVPLYNVAEYELSFKGRVWCNTGKEKAKKSTVANTLSPAVKHEHALVGQALLEIIGSRLNPEVDWLYCVLNNLLIYDST